MKKVLALLVVAAMAGSSIMSCGKAENEDGEKSKTVSSENVKEITEETKEEKAKKEQEAKNKEIFEISKEAYDNIEIAYEITNEFSNDIYEAWRMGIYDGDELTVKLFASETSISEAEILTAFNNFSDKDFSTSELNLFFGYIDDSTDISLFTLCTAIVMQAYEDNGKIEKVQTALEEAKIQMKTLSENYSDYEHYPSLKGYYTTANSFFGFCMEPDCSFDQLQEVLNSYSKEARDYKADLEFIFED